LGLGPLQLEWKGKGQCWRMVGESGDQMHLEIVGKSWVVEAESRTAESGVAFAAGFAVKWKGLALPVPGLG